MTPAVWYKRGWIDGATGSVHPHMRQAEKSIMSTFTIRHYRAANLPAELRDGLSDDALVSVTVEEEKRPTARPADTPAAPSTPHDRQIELFEDLVRRTRNHAARSQGLDRDEPVRRIRELRDEWRD